MLAKQELINTEGFDKHQQELIDAHFAEFEGVTIKHYYGGRAIDRTDMETESTEATHPYDKIDLNSRYGRSGE